MMKCISKSESAFLGLYKNDLLETVGNESFLKLDNLQIIFKSDTPAGVVYNCDDFTIFEIMELSDSQRNIMFIKLDKKSFIQTKIHAYPYDEKIYRIFYNDEVLFFYDTVKQTIFAKNFENKVLWERIIYRSPQIVYEFNNVLIITYHKGQDLLTALNIDTGEELWSFEVDKELNYNPVKEAKPVILNQYLQYWNDNVIFLVSFWGMVSLNLFNGEIQWKEKGRGFSVIFGDYGYSISEEAIIEYDVQDCSIIRSKDIRDYADGLEMSMFDILVFSKYPLITEKNIFFGGKDYVFAVDRKTFDLVQVLKIDASGGVYSDQVYYDGHIYILDYYNYLHKIKDFSESES